MRNIMAKMTSVLFLAVFSLCTNNHTTSTDPAEPTLDSLFGLSPNQYEAETVNYSLRNNDNIIYIITNDCKCDTSGEKNSVTSLREVPYNVIDDSLQIFLSKDSVGTSKTPVRFYKKYSRMPACTSDCSSIYGYWKLGNDGFVADAPLAPADSQIAENILIQSREGYDYLYIGTYNIVIYNLLDSLRSFAWHFMENWNKYYSSRTSVVVDTSKNGDSIVLFGRVDHDSVWISQDLTGQITTRAKDTSLHTYVYNPLSSDCPKVYYPSWFEEVFLRNNSSDIPYIAIDSPKPGDTLHVGDTIQASIAFNDAFVTNNTGITISVSVNGGLNWYSLVCTESGYPQIRIDKSYSHQPHIVIPEVLKTDDPADGTVSPVSNEALFEVVSYTNHTARSQTSSSIVILPRSESLQ
jgi:hypothetical protein